MQNYILFPTPPNFISVFRQYFLSEFRNVKMNINVFSNGYMLDLRFAEKSSENICLYVSKLQTQSEDFSNLTYFPPC